MDEYEQFIKDIIVKAGSLTLEYFGKIGVDHTKSGGVNDVVTIADLKSQKLIVDAIQKRFPTHGIIGEEDANIQTNAEYVWYIDPIDGTRNYSKSIPLYGVMIALTKNRDVIMSAIYLPIFKELYFAKKGCGAFVNDKKITCSVFAKYIDSNGILGSVWHKNRKQLNDNIIHHMFDGSVFMSSVGSIAVASCMIASGRKDWLISDNGGVWDYAAPSLLLRESGCIITDLKGTEWKLGEKHFIVANPTLHKELLNVTRDL